MKLWVGILLVVFLLALLIVWIVALPDADPNVSNQVAVDTKASLGTRLVFPKGYHLVTAYGIKETYQVPSVTYICQSDDDPTDYRVCTPELAE